MYCNRQQKTWEWGYFLLEIVNIPCNKIKKKQLVCDCTVLQSSDQIFASFISSLVLCPDLFQKIYFSKRVWVHSLHTIPFSITYSMQTFSRGKEQINEATGIFRKLVSLWWCIKQSCIFAAPHSIQTQSTITLITIYTALKGYCKQLYNCKIS